MTCRDFTAFIAEYLAGGLSSETRARFEWHLGRCENCRAYLSHYMAAIQLGPHAFQDADADVPPDVPEDLIRAIMDVRPR